MSYPINEIFYSLQGEGARVGAPSVFVRFAGCNLNCTVATAGFDCDTDHSEHRSMSVSDVVAGVHRVAPGLGCPWVVFTGGEPLLHLDAELADRLCTLGFLLAVETNGTIALKPELEERLDHVTCSPKRGQPVKLKQADEVRIVLPEGEYPPDKPPLMAERWYLSPAARGGVIPESAVRWCVDRCLAAPDWHLSTQQHKVWGFR